MIKAWLIQEWEEEARVDSNNHKSSTVAHIRSLIDIVNMPAYVWSIRWQAGNEYTVDKGLKSCVFIANCIQWIQIYAIIYRFRNFDLHLLRPHLPILIFPAELSLCVPARIQAALISTFSWYLSRAIPFLSPVGDGRFQTIPQPHPEVTV